MSLKCCPSMGSDVTSDYNHVFWASCAVAILAGVAFLSAMWVLFRSSPPSGRWVPRDHLGVWTAIVCRVRAVLLWDVHSTRRVHVTLTVKERLGSTFGNGRFETFTDLEPSEKFDHKNGDRVLYKVESSLLLFVVLIFCVFCMESPFAQSQFSDWRIGCF
jgi:hypothetical protein